MEAKIFLHGMIELVSVVLSLVISWFAFKRYKEIPSGYYLLWGMAFFTTAIFEIYHMGVGFWVENVERYSPWTWITARLNLVLMLGFASWTASQYMKREQVVGYTFVTVGVLIFSMLPLWFSSLLEGVLIPTQLVVRPLDLLLAAGWLVLLWVYYEHPLTRVQSPRGFQIFLGLGLLSHLVMAFGASSYMNGWFILGHFVKLAEYSVWCHFLLQENIEAKMLKEGYRSVIRLHLEERSDTALRQLNHSIESLSECVKRRQG